MRTAKVLGLLLVAWFCYQTIPLLRLPQVCEACALIALIALAVGAFHSFYISLHHRSL